MISQISPNYEYAPGIAMYGLPGKTGAQGQDANNIFFTDCTDLLNKEEVGYQNITVQIQGGLEPIADSTKSAERAYQVNDYFLSIDNFLYQLSEYDNNGQETNITFKKIACLNLNNNSASHFSYNNRLIYDSSFGGLSILNRNNNASSNAALYIDESRIDSNGNINFLQLSTITDNTNITSLFITYNVYNQAFMLTSDQPIVIDSPTLQVNRTTGGEDFNEYTSVVLSDNPITRFKESVGNTAYHTVNNPDNNNYAIIKWDISDASQYIISMQDSLHLKVYSAGNTFIYPLKFLTPEIINSFIIKDSQNNDITITYTCSINQTGTVFDYQLSCSDPNIILDNITISYQAGVTYDNSTHVLSINGFKGTARVITFKYTETVNNTTVTTDTTVKLKLPYADPITYLNIITHIPSNQIQLVGAVYNIEVYIKQEASN